MNIVLIGYGKMGKEIEQVALERGHEVVLRIDLNNPGDLNTDSAAKADVAIEFTSPGSVVENLYKCFDLGLPVVTGTTGWHERLGEVREKCLDGGNSLLYASNFSLGVNLFFALNEQFARMMESFPEYEVSMKEVHHTRKLDAPSGTAVTLAELLIKELSRKSQWSLGEKADSKSIGIEAIREGDVTGIHQVKYESDIDFIELSHHAKNRKGFATGAVMAAEFLPGKKGIFSMRDLLGI